MSDIHYCHKCGRSLIDEAKYCPYCGTRVLEEMDIVSEEAIFEHYEENCVDVEGKVKWEGVIPQQITGIPKYKCLCCGYVYEGPREPKECPVCHVKSDKLVPVFPKIRVQLNHYLGMFRTVKPISQSHYTAQSLSLPDRLQTLSSLTLALSHIPTTRSFPGCFGSL